MLTDLYEFNHFLHDKLIQTDLALSDILILNYILDYITDEDDYITENGISYVYISHDTFCKELPILRYNKQTFKNKLSQLKKTEWILSITKRSTNHGSMSYYTVSDKCLNLLSTEDKLSYISKFRGTQKSTSIGSTLKSTPYIPLILETKDSMIPSSQTYIAFMDSKDSNISSIQVNKELRDVM